MANWRCPSCGAPQTEAAQCWVCHRSTTTCSTCRHYRKAVAVRLGYCALDRTRAPLGGGEERSCWERSARETFEPGEHAAPFDPDPNGLWAALNSPPADTPLSPRALEMRRRDPWPQADIEAPSTMPPDATPAEPLPLQTAAIRQELATEPVRREPASLQHGRSVRDRPWGRVPGEPDKPVRRFGLRDRVGRWT